MGAPTTWVLSNHDVVRHVTRYGGGERGLARARAAALLMLALPGSAYVYQGEELGLPEVLDLPDDVRQDPAFRRTAGQEGLRDGCRVPIPWSGRRPPYDFGPAGSWLPQPDDWAGLSVAAQTGDPHSTLELYRAALELRRALPGLGAPEAGRPGPAREAAGDRAEGDADRAEDGAADTGIRWLPAPEGVLLFSRPGFACTLNGRPVPVELPAPGRPVLSSAPVAADGRTAVLPADSCTWWAI
ncbi:hypothetical protein GCM10010371_66850 [Streptomyces subrutilus]|uniref:Glycosyl hydrolase family 13 catalytic domain-containing protein n=1 Tax=Streptomyces subrutilus TaxID=36818 RepID=A0A918VHA9_9ACTN|nr:hypothetical protein GCM10010371_66850 [Streptomyces subrutilus]